MKKYLILLFIPFIMFASCVKDNSAYLPQDKENIKVDSVKIDDDGETEEPIDGILTPGIHLVKLNVTEADGQVVEHRFKYFMPVSITKDRPISLIFEFHGSYEIKEGVEVPDPLSGISISHPWNQLAIKENCIIVFPAGENNGKSVDWSIGGYEKNLPFVDAMVDFFKRSTPTIDFTRIYSSGQSSGAIFSFNLAFKRSEIFAAVAPRAGQMKISDDDVLPTRAVHCRLFAGVDDETVSHSAALANMTIWAEKIGGYYPVNMELKEEAFEIDKYKKVTTRKWTGANADIEIYSLIEEGHNINLYSCASYIWEFFKAHTFTTPQPSLYVNVRDTLIQAREGQKFAIPFLHTENATVTVDAPSEWLPVVEKNMLYLTAPSNFMSSEQVEGEIKFTVTDGGKTATRNLPYQLTASKAYFSVGDVYYNNNDEAVGVVIWVNSKDKRDAKIINFDTPGQYGTIHFNTTPLGSDFDTPNKEDGLGNTKLLLDKNNTLPTPNNKNASAYVWANEYTYKGVTNWYIPAINEWLSFSKNIAKVNSVITQLGGKKIEKLLYSSTTEIISVNDDTKNFYYFNADLGSAVAKKTSAEYSAFNSARAIKIVRK